MFSPSSVSFNTLNQQERVKNIQVTPQTTTYQIDLDEFDPYECEYCLFYSTGGSASSFQVWGVIGAVQIIALDGLIDLYLDLAHVNTISLMDYTEDMDIEEEDEGDAWFWIPILDLPRDVSMNMAASVPIDQIQRRIAWYLNCGMQFQPLQGDNMDTMDQGVFLATGVLTRFLSGQSRQTFFDIRMHLERIRMQQWYSKIATSDNAVLRLLLRNHLKGYMEDIMLTAPTCRDLQSFLLRMPVGTPPPTVVFRVLMEDIPSSLARLLPVHENGFLHLTRYELFEWIWQCTVSQELRMLSEPVDEQKHEQASFLQREAERVHEFIQAHLRQLTKKAKDHLGLHLTTTNTSGIEEVAVETSQLISLVPACFRQVMTQKAFMKNNQRWPWLITMREAGVAKESAVAFLEQMNAAYPLNNLTLKARVDYDYVWNWTNKNACKCGNLVKGKALDQVISCPFTASATPDIEDLVSYSKKRCMQDRNDWRGFDGPATLIHRKLVEQHSK